MGRAQAGAPLSSLRYAQEARDWVEWRAAVLVANQQRLWGGWPGYFPRNWSWNRQAESGVSIECLSLKPAAVGNRLLVNATNENSQQSCPCAACQASSLRRSADVADEAFEAWVRARAESDIERTAALEAARAAAAAAQKTAEMQAKKVRFVAPRNREKIKKGHCEYFEVC
jgi:hypothetical protein